jgi:hypothetical protein
VEALDYLDVRELHRRGYLIRRYVPRWPEFLGPGIERIRFDRYLIHIELLNQVTPQHIQITWTPCNFGGDRPWMHCPHCDRRVARLFKGLSGYFCRDCVGDPPSEVSLVPRALNDADRNRALSRASILGSQRILHHWLLATLFEQIVEGLDS